MASERDGGSTCPACTRPCDVVEPLFGLWAAVICAISSVLRAGAMRLKVDFTSFKRAERTPSGAVDGSFVASLRTFLIRSLVWGWLDNQVGGVEPLPLCFARVSKNVAISFGL